MSVVVIGDANVDLEIRLPSGRSIEHANPDPIMSGGGSAANTAAGLARLGVPCTFVGTVGDDAGGRFAVSSLAEAGVDVSRMRSVQDEATVMVIVIVQPNGERLIYVWPPRGGAHAELDRSTAVSAVGDARWLHVSGICLRVSPAREALLSAMEHARQVGATVSLDLNLRLENWGWEEGFRDVARAAIDRADVVLGAAVDEISALAGIADPVEAAAVLAGDERTVIARAGEHGAAGHRRGVVTSAPGFDIDVADTVGAGDAFNAGFIAARLEGAGLEDALRWGNGVAALTISKSGARSTPSRSEVRQLLSER